MEKLEDQNKTAYEYSVSSDMRMQEEDKVMDKSDIMDPINPATVK